MDRRLPHLPGVPHLDINRPSEKNIHIMNLVLSPNEWFCLFLYSPAGCQDGYHTRRIWAAKGDCTKNRAWMTKNCKRSCRVCGSV